MLTISDMIIFAVAMRCYPSSKENGKNQQLDIRAKVGLLLSTIWDAIAVEKSRASFQMGVCGQYRITYVRRCK